MRDRSAPGPDGAANVVAALRDAAGLARDRELAAVRRPGRRGIVAAIGRDGLTLAALQLVRKYDRLLLFVLVRQATQPLVAEFDPYNLYGYLKFLSQGRLH